MKKLSLLLVVVAAFGMLLSACGSDDDDGGKKHSGIPFGGQKFLDSNAAGYFLPTLYVDGENSKLAFWNDDGVFYYDFADKKEYSVPQSSGTQELHRGQMIITKNYIIWQYSLQDLYAYNLNTKSVKRIAIESPMLYSMCVTDGYILVMSVNKKVYACNILTENCTSSMPYTSGSGSTSLAFACNGHKMAVGAKEDGADSYKMLIADWDVVGNTLNFKPASRVEIPIVGEPKQVVMNDKYVAFVNNFNDIYSIELSEVEELGDTAKAYAVISQDDPNELIEQISDLYLYDNILVWSDNTSSLWWPYYADLSSRDTTTGLYVKMSQMSNDSITQKNPCTDGKKVYWSYWADDSSDDAVPVLWVGEIGAEVQH